MDDLTRRGFLKYAARLATAMGLGVGTVPKIAGALEKMAGGSVPVLWLQGQSCSGCSISLLNSQEMGPAALITTEISLAFHGNLSAATGKTAMEVVNRSIDAGGFVLAVEGSIPSKMPEACTVGHEPVADQVVRAARRARAVVAVGTCAAFGGIPAAENNPTGAMGVPEFLRQQGVSGPVVSLPGCPVHPDWVVGTLVHLLHFGPPSLDTKGRPRMFFSKLIHDQCPRFADYEREKFARNFSEDGCLFKLGCLGPNTHADCTLRHWNGGVNTCISAGAPCIGCASPDFSKKRSLPFYRKGEGRG